MSNVKQAQFETTIKAPIEVVWEKLLGAESYQKWTEAFAPGGYFEGTWQEGTRMKFLAPSGDGMISEIAEHRPNEFISIRHIGVVSGGKEDTESESVKAWAPACENYSASPIEGGTKLVVEQDLPEDSEKSMLEVWAKAFDALRALCEE